MQLYGLLYVNWQNARHVNLQAGADPVDVYLRCAVTLANSCAAAGIPFAIVTNEAALLRQRLTAIGASADLVEIAFTRDIPKGITFYEAHFKLDVIAAFATGNLGQQIGLVDIDAVVMADGELLTAALADADLLAFRLAGAFADERDAMAADLRRAGADEKSALTWYGGEFIAGTAEGFRKLAAEIDKVWAIYKSQLADMGHVGDEPIVSAALSNIQMQGATVKDLSAGPGFTVARWWSSRTLGPQIRFREVEGASVLHLPSDKTFLAGHAASVPFTRDGFLRAYKAYATRKLLPRRLATALQALLGRRGVHVPRL